MYAVCIFVVVVLLVWWFMVPREGYAGDGSNYAVGEQPWTREGMYSKRWGG